MSDKKRKGTSAVTAPPAKKTKKDVAASAASTPTPAEPAPLAEKTTRTRKRASDFLDDDEAPADVVSKSSKSKKKAKSESLTADGANALVEHPDDAEPELVTTKQPASSSMLAEAQRTVDQEIEDEFGGFGETKDAGEADAEDDAEDEEIDEAPALLNGFDSDDEDTAEDKGVDLNRTAPIPQYKKTQKKLRKAAESGNKDGPGSVYIGRIPHGFYEKQMREYFSQFGEITKLRLSRNKKTGASKHFAFVEFASLEVAKIVAETMDNYLMFGHILKCKFAPQDSLHPDVWKGANKRYRRIPHARIEKAKLEEPKTAEQWQKQTAKVQKKRTKKAEQLKALGYDYESPTLASPAAVVERRKLEQAEQKALTQDENTVPEEADQAIPVADKEDTVPKASKKAKRGKSDQKPEVQPLTEVNLMAKDQNISPGEAATQKAREGDVEEKVDETVADMRTNVRTTIPSSQPLDKSADGKAAPSKKSSKTDKKSKSETTEDVSDQLPMEDKIVLAANAKESSGRSTRKTSVPKAETAKRKSDGSDVKSILKKSKKT